MSLSIDLDRVSVTFGDKAALSNLTFSLDGPATFFNRWFDRAEDNAPLGVIASIAFSAAALYGVRLITRTAPIKSQAE